MFTAFEQTGNVTPRLGNVCETCIGKAIHSDPGVLLTVHQTTYKGIVIFQIYSNQLVAIDAFDVQPAIDVVYISSMRYSHFRDDKSPDIGLAEVHITPRVVFTVNTAA